MNPRERVRQHIRKQFSALATLNFSTELSQTLEDEFLQLFNDYARAPQDAKDDVYERGERRILNIIDAETHKSLTASGEHYFEIG